MPIAVAEARYAQRGASQAHHAAHAARTLPTSAFEEYQSPFNLGPVIEVDTTGPVDIATIAREITELLRS